MFSPHATDQVRTARRGRLMPILLSILMLLAVAASAGAGAGGPLLTPGPAPAVEAPKVAAWPRESAAAAKNLSTTVDWTYVSGLDFANLGASVGTVGDLNGDGYSDAAVGAPNMRNPATSGRVGAVLVFFGGPGGLPSVPNQILYGPAYFSNYVEFGAALSPAGDVNGDGFGDLLVGAPGWGGDGAVFVYHGSAGGLATSYDWTWTLDDFTGGSARLGAAVSTAGDVDGDGYDDVVVGAPVAWAGQRGRIAFFRGGPGGLAAAPALDLTGNELGDRLGASVAAAGDVNADGLDDVIVGVPGARNGGFAVGSAWIFHGSVGGLPALPSTVLTGPQTDAVFGGAVSGAGDMNGDGFADVAVGAPFWDTAWAVDAGRAAVFPGGPAGVGATPLWEEFGNALNDQFGAELAPGGDVNGDGLGDLLVGAPNFSNGGAGRGLVSLVTGSRVGSIFIPWYRFDAQQVLFGAAVGTAGDIDGDGFSDVLVGSWGFTGAVTLEGRVEMFRGAADAPCPTIGWQISSSLAGSFYGWVIAAAGDVNGDGFDDVLATAPNYSYLAPADGLVVLFMGGTNGPQYGANWFAVGPYGGSSFGYSAACAGDVNGDGYDDIVIGAPDSGNEGFVQVWHGSPSGPRFGPPDWSVDGFQAGSNFGRSVASAGDVNGDGYADVIVGAPNDDGDDLGNPGLANEGKAYLFLGSASGLGAHAWSVRGLQQEGNLGNSVAGAGDVNGDGYGDVIVGMEAWDRPLGGGFALLDVGRALVYHGGPGGLAAAPSRVLEGSGNANFGHVVNTAGDVDGDGYSDVIVTAVYSDPDNQGSAAVFRGSAAGVAGGAWWSFTSAQPFSAFGSSAGPAGDVNGDGLSDIVVGSVFGDTGGYNDNGRVWVFAGPLTGSLATTAIRQWGGTQSYENLGNSVAGVGDVNGDGFADVGAGSPGYSGGVAQEGRTVVWFGNNRYVGYDTLVRAAQQLRSDTSAPIGLGGLTTGGSSFVLQAWAGSAAGRTDVRLEWQVAPLGTALGGAVSAGPWADSMPAGIGAPASFYSPPLAVPGPGPAHWRLRVAGRSPYFPHSPWLSPSRNGRQETDLRWPAWLSGVDQDVALPLPPARLRAAPNPFNPRTRLSFDLRRDGQVRIELYDLAGRRVATLLDEPRPAGPVEVVWDGRDAAGRAVASGTYFVRAAGAGETATAKVTLVR